MRERAVVPLRVFFGIWAVLVGILLVTGFKFIIDGRFPDPDDALRLVQVRDLLAGQSWYDLHQYRITPPEGSLMHWSRIVDLPLVLLIGALAPLFGSGLAEKLALVIIPLMTLTAVLWFVARLAFEKFERETAVFACLALGLNPAVLYQLQPYRIDHHGYQILAVAIALWATARSNTLRGGIAAGLAMAVGTVISIELLPMVAAFGLVFALRWLRDPSKSLWLASYMAALTAGMVLCFLVFRGLGDLAPHCDVVAPAHIAFFAITTAGTLLLAVFARASVPLLIGGFGVAGLAGVAAFEGIAPQCVGSPFADLDPLVRDIWYDHVFEGLPAWRQQWTSAVPVLAQVSIAFAALIAVIRRTPVEKRGWWLEFALLFACAIGAGLLTYRSMAFAGLLAAFPIGWLARRLLERWRETRAPLQKALLTVFVCVALLPSSPIAIAALVAPKADGKTALVDMSDCELRKNIPRLDQIEPTTIFAPLDIGPAIIESSHHGVVATGHHRAKDAMFDVMQAFTSSPDEARRIVNSHQAEMLVICVSLAEPGFMQDRGGTDSLAHALVTDQPPDWLEPMAFELPEHLKVYRVK